MDSKEILTEIKADLKKSLDAWESFLNSIEVALIGGDWVIAEKVSSPILEAVKKIEQALETSVEPQQEYTEPGLEKVFMSVEGGSINIYDMTNDVIVNVIEHDNKDVYIVTKDEKGSIITKPNGKYTCYNPKEMLCSHCNKPTSFESTETSPSEGEKCELCDSWVCNDCVDWKCMSKTNTEAIICKKCSQIFENCKEES